MDDIDTNCLVAGTNETAELKFLYSANSRYQKCQKLLNKLSTTTSMFTEETTVFQVLSLVVSPWKLILFSITASVYTLISLSSVSTTRSTVFDFYNEHSITEKCGQLLNYYTTLDIKSVLTKAMLVQHHHLKVLTHFDLFKAKSFRGFVTQYFKQCKIGYVRFGNGTEETTDWFKQVTNLEQIFRFTVFRWRCDIYDLFLRYVQTLICRPKYTKKMENMRSISQSVCYTWEKIKFKFSQRSQLSSLQLWFSSKHNRDYSFKYSKQW